MTTTTPAVTLTPGRYLDVQGVRFDLDGQGLADFLAAAGYTVVRNWDAGTNGWVLLSNGLQVSTNGYVAVATRTCGHCGSSHPADRSCGCFDNDSQ